MNFRPGKNLFMLVGTGMGKTIAYTWGVDVARVAQGIPGGLAVVTAPLTAILTQKLAENPEDMLMLTFEGSLQDATGRTDAQPGGPLEEELYKGKYKAVIGHPEAWATATGQRILMGLKTRKLLILATVVLNPTK